MHSVYVLYEYLIYQLKANEKKCKQTQSRFVNQPKTLDLACKLIFMAFYVAPSNIIAPCVHMKKRANQIKKKIQNHRNESCVSSVFFLVKIGNCFQSAVQSLHTVSHSIEENMIRQRARLQLRLAQQIDNF